MKTIGFPISHKENEKRRAIIPRDLALIKNCDYIYIEKGYGDVLGYSDADYQQYCVHISTREEVLKQDIICDPKIGDAEYLNTLQNQVIFGWVHAVQNRDITDVILQQKLTAIAWEDMFDGGRHLFWRNNEIAGEAALCHAYLLHGIFPYNTKVAVIGRGNVARGALRTLNFMGADVVVYDRHTEKLLSKEIGEYDVIVNALLWDTTRKDHIIYREDLQRMKKGAMIIDVSCDRAGAIETSIPTTLENPTYVVDGITHYVVDHTPSLFYKTTSECISEVVCRFIDNMVEESNNTILTKALSIQEGTIIDQRIVEFQNR
jgi:N5-(carboxyethyl)ornithine synthase